MAANPSTDTRLVRSVREQVSAQEWQARTDLAACYRLVDLFGMTELIANHISCRVPGEPNHFLINPFGLLYDEITASKLVKIDFDGNIVFQSTDHEVNTAGFVIHSAIHMARHNVDCVAHTHTPAGMAVSALECGLLPVAQSSMRFVEIAYHEFEGVADRLDERERIVADLGQQEAMILRNHGLLVAAQSVPSAFALLYRLERACQTQILAMSCHTKLHLPPQQVLQRSLLKARGNDPARSGELGWPSLLRRLDRIDTSFRD